MEPPFFKWWLTSRVKQQQTQAERWRWLDESCFVPTFLGGRKNVYNIYLYLQYIYIYFHPRDEGYVKLKKMENGTKDVVIL